jgi:hypothetical protein
MKINTTFVLMKSDEHSKNFRFAQDLFHQKFHSKITKAWELFGFVVIASKRLEPLSPPYDSPLSLPLDGFLFLALRTAKTWYYSTRCF